MPTLKHSSNQSRIPFRCSPTRNTNTYFYWFQRPSTFSFQYRVPSPPWRNFFSVSSLRKEFSGRLVTSWKTRDFSNRPGKLLRGFGGLKQLCEFRGRWIFIPTYACFVYNTNVMQRNTCYGSAIQLLSVYPSLAKQWKQHEDRQNSVNNCKGLCVFRCDNFLPSFRFSSNAEPLNSKFDVLMKMFLFLAVSYMYTLCKSFAKNPSSKICVIIIYS